MKTFVMFLNLLMIASPLVIGCGGNKVSLKNATVRKIDAAEALAELKASDFDEAKLRSYPMKKIMSTALESGTNDTIEIDGFTFDDTLQYVEAHQEAMAKFNEDFPTIGDLLDEGGYTDLSSIDEGLVKDAIENLHNAWTSAQNGTADAQMDGSSEVSTPKADKVHLLDDQICSALSARGSVGGLIGCAGGPTGCAAGMFLGAFGTLVFCGDYCKREGSAQFDDGSRGCFNDPGAISALTSFHH